MKKYQDLNDYLEQEARNEMQRRKVQYTRKEQVKKIVRDTLSTIGYALGVAIMFTAMFGAMLIMQD